MSSSSSFSGEAEQRQLGRNGVDVIDEFCEASIFDEAAKYLTKSNLKLSNDQKLTFYALFKQATIGPCNTPKPSLLYVYDRTKWNSWNDLGKMNKDEAILRYLNELEKVAPSWREESGNLVAVDSDDESGGGGGGGSNGAMIMPQSRPIAEDEVPEAEMDPNQKHIWHYAGQNNIEKVKEFIQNGVSVNEKDDEGRTSVAFSMHVGSSHWANACHLLTSIVFSVASLLSFLSSFSFPSSVLSTGQLIAVTMIWPCVW